MGGRVGGCELGHFGPAAVRPVELEQLPAEAPPPRVKLVEVVAGAVELLPRHGNLSQLVEREA